MIAEAAVYRETLKLEIQNLRIYGIKAKQKMTSFGGGNPLLAFGIPLLTSFVARKRKASKWGALAFMGWQIYNRFGTAMVNRFTSSSTPISRDIAAEEYLERRM
ncbi:MAG: hypothetical protein H7Y43_08660 [Akkermansiaceae bacterium]|nr:hypothetical protein [Verrucomicrobiales bacterium]